MLDQPDVFLSYHSFDREIVLVLVERLKERLIRVWIDDGELKPGTAGYRRRIEKAVKKSRGALIVVWSFRIGPGAEKEIDLCVQETNRRSEFSLIPLLLPGGSLMEIPALLTSHFSISDLSNGLDNKHAFDRLEWAITGADMHLLAIKAMSDEVATKVEKEVLIDSLAMAYVKAQIYRAADASAAHAASIIAAADDR